MAVTLGMTNRKGKAYSIGHFVRKDECSSRLSCRKLAHTVCIAGAVLFGEPMAMPKLKECITLRRTAVSTAAVTGAFCAAMTGTPSSSFFEVDADRLALLVTTSTPTELSILAFDASALRGAAKSRPLTKATPHTSGGGLHRPLYYFRAIHTQKFKGCDFVKYHTHVYS